MGSLTAVWREGVTFHREEHAKGAVRVPTGVGLSRGGDLAAPRQARLCALCTHLLCQTTPRLLPQVCRRTASAGAAGCGCQPAPWATVVAVPGPGDGSRSHSIAGQDGTGSRWPPPRLQTCCAHTVRSSRKAASRYSFLAVPFPS